MKLFTVVQQVICTSYEHNFLFAARRAVRQGLSLRDAEQDFERSEKSVAPATAA